MTLDDYLHISTIGIQTAVLVSAPVLLLGLVAGLAVSIFQAATQISDSSLAFIPKILAVMIALVFFGPWMVTQMATYATYTLNQIPNVTL
ncbi:MAG: flagellar biosynthesis protein FliQ [Deltaproteobacteria bacterium]|nr:flagellar biosynthesis protein FliQ [Deltaproteobacteria bacterium]